MVSAPVVPYSQRWSWAACRDLSGYGTCPGQERGTHQRSGCSTTPCPWLSGCRSGPGWTSSPMASGVVRPMLRFSPRRWTGSSRDLVPRAGARVSERLAAPSDQYDHAVVSSINQKRPIAAGEAEFLRITKAPVSSSPSHRLTPWAGACGAPSILPRPSRRARISWRR